MAVGASVWERSLPGSGYGIVNLLPVGNIVYAGSRGYVYRLEAATGNVAATNGLPGFHYGEVRFALTPTTLIVGTDGYVLGLDPTTLATIWQTSLPSTGNNSVSVLIEGGFIFAGSFGYVFRLDASTGAILNTNGLPGTGTYDVRLVIGFGKLLVGTNGFVLALSLTDVSTTWTCSLPGSRYHVVNLACSSTSIFAGSYGYMYRLDTQGVVQNTNDLPGLNYAEVRVAAHGPYVTAGTYGSVVCFRVENLAFQWKTDLDGAFGQIVSVLMDGQMVYAASNGLAFGLTLDGGRVVRREGLSGLGYHEVSLAMNGPSLVMGSNGYVANSPLAISNFTLQHQEQTLWCWAATTVSVAGFYNVNTFWKTQCRLVNEILKQTTCCENGSSAQCNHTSSTENALKFTKHWQSTTEAAEPMPIIASEISKGQPLCAIVEWPDKSSHATLITGVHPEGTIDIQDPWSGFSTLTVDAFTNRYQGNGVWTRSLHTVASQVTT